MDIAERLHQLMLRPGFQAREDQRTLLEGKQEIDRLRTALRDIQARSVGNNVPRHTWYYDRAEEALAPVPST